MLFLQGSELYDVGSVRARLGGGDGVGGEGDGKEVRERAEKVLGIERAIVEGKVGGVFTFILPWPSSPFHLLTDISPLPPPSTPSPIYATAQKPQISPHHPRSNHARPRLRRNILSHPRCRRHAETCEDGGGEECVGRGLGGFC